MVNLSTRPTTGLSKSDRVAITTFTRYLQCPFKSLTSLIAKDYVYSPFNYLGYTRSLYNICSDANFVVIDIDHTALSITQQFEHITSEGYTCILGTTSDPSNMHKYRLLMPLDQPVSAEQYRNLIHGIRINQLVPDMDPASAKPSQPFFSYLNSTVLSDFSGTTLPVADYIVEPEAIEPSALDPAELIDNFPTEFGSYRNASPGNRTKCLLSAAFRMSEAGFTPEQLATGVLTINSWFLVPKSNSDVYRRVINFIIQRKYK